MKKSSPSVKAVICAAAIIVTTVTTAFAESQFNPVVFVQDSLENGLHVIYQVDRTAPVVATVIQYRVGSRDETVGRTGYAHFFEHLMFEATDKIPRASIDKFTQEAGGELNAHTSFDETVFYFQLPANQVKFALWVESQRMRGLLFDTTGVETQRRVVLEEQKERRDNSPYGTFLDKWFANLFKSGTYHWTTLGSAEDIKSAKISDFKQFYDNFYQPNNATLVIAGDIDIDQVRSYVKAYFGSYPRSAEQVRAAVNIVPIDKEYREQIVDEKAQLPGIFVAYLGPRLDDSSYFATTILTDILASGESSRLYQRLVDKDQLAAQASAFPYSLEKSGIIGFYAIAAIDIKTVKLEKALFDELDKVVTKGITDEELEKAKNIREAGFVAGKKDALDKAQSLASYYSYFRNANLINTELDDFLKVTKEDVIKAARKYLATDKRVIVTYLPKNYKD